MQVERSRSTVRRRDSGVRKARRTPEPALKGIRSASVVHASDCDRREL